MQRIADHDGGGVDTILGQLLASRESEAAESMAAPEEAIADLEQSVEENAADLPESKKRSAKKNPLLAWTSDVDDEQPVDGHPSRARGR